MINTAGTMVSIHNEATKSLALQRLPDDQRTAIVLREFEGYTSREIGDLVGAPAATVRSRIFHGLKSLRAMLPEHEVIAAGDQEVRHG